jgi:site-specific DNA-methyltransferase (adenine-specific)
MINLMYGDCREKSKSIKPESVDLIATDLPYGTTQCKWDSVIPFDDLWSMVKRVLKSKGVFITTSSQPFTSALIMSNPDWFRCEWIWEKSRASGFLDANKKPLKSHENIVVFSGKPGVYNPQGLIDCEIKTGKGLGKGTGDALGDCKVKRYVRKKTNYPRSVIKFNSVSSNKAVHNTEKPLDLYEYIIKTYSNPGEIVFDPCMGSGVTGKACVSTGRSFIVIDNNQSYYDIAEKRIFGTAVPKLEQGSPDETGYVGPKKLVSVDGKPIDPAICQV